MKSTFCVLPFYGLELQPAGVTPCCLLPNGTDIKQVRQDALAGVQNPACNKCWSLEAENKVSNRTIINRSFDFYANQDIELVEQNCRGDLYDPQIIKLYTSNLCNSTCVTCGPRFSTAWSTLESKPIYNILPDSRIKFDYSKIKIISFVGGEPLFEKKNYEVLNNLIQAGNTNCLVDITTNGSVQLSDEQLDIFKKFKHVNFCLSIDGIGRVFEYLRYPLKWDQLVKNIEIFKSLNINLSVSYTVSKLNVMYQDQTIRWFESMGLPYNFNLVSHPSYFSPSIESAYDLKRLKYELLRQDSLKGISVQDYLPEFYNTVLKDVE